MSDKYNFLKLELVDSQIMHTSLFSQRGAKKLAFMLVWISVTIYNTITDIWEELLVCIPMF